VSIFGFILFYVKHYIFVTSFAAVKFAKYPLCDDHT